MHMLARVEQVVWVLFVHYILICVLFIIVELLEDYAASLAAAGGLSAGPVRRFQVSKVLKIDTNERACLCVWFVFAFRTF